MRVLAGTSCTGSEARSLSVDKRAREVLKPFCKPGWAWGRVPARAAMEAYSAFWGVDGNVVLNPLIGCANGQCAYAAEANVA
jgi:hypothetical protein